MPTTIKLKNSVTTTNAPSSLEQGEVAINITDKKVWVGNAATTPIQLLGAGGSASFGALTCTSLTNSALTSGRVTYAGTSGVLQDDADFTFNGTTVTMANDASISGLTVGKGNSAIASNAAFGTYALYSNTTGANSVAVGQYSLQNNTTGDSNTAVGLSSLNTNTTGGSNTAIGRQALNSNTTASYNTAVGYQAGYSTTTGTPNTYTGAFAGYGNTTGVAIVANGYVALYNNSTGSYNTAIGRSALEANTTQSYSTAVGYQAAYSNTTGQITAIGTQSGYSNTTGLYNTAVGISSMYSNTTGQYNTVSGYQALFSNTTANNNTAVGYQALYSNTTGANNTAVGYFALKSTAGNTARNTAVGSNALQANTSGEDNTALGYQAGYSTTSGTQNTALGTNALRTNTTASESVAVGADAAYNSTGGAVTIVGKGAGYNLTTGNNNTFIGVSAGYYATTGTRNTFIGVDAGISGGAGGAITTGSRNTIIGGYSGNNGGLDIRTASNYIVLSDGDGNPRQVIDGSGNVFVGSTSIISSEKFGVTQSANSQVVSIYAKNASYTSDAFVIYADRNTTNNTFYVLNYFNGGAAAYKFRVADSGNVTNTNGSYGTISDIKNKENIVDATSKLDKVNQLKVRNYNFIGDDLKQIGFVAQEFEQVFPSMVEEHKDTDKDGNDLGTTTKSIKTSVLVPILVKAVQELTAKVEALEAQLNK